MGQPPKVSTATSSRSWSAREVVVANISSMLTYILGTLIIFHVGALFGMLYIIFVITELILFMRFVCIYCPTYNRIHCPSGYGKMAAMMFKKGEVARFRQMFNRFIPFLSLVWVVPVLGALVLLYSDFSSYYLGLLVSFVIVGYIILPMFHRHFGCRECPNKGNCPWGK
ncbi:MAG: hypothetical protein KAW09_08685 [Thermoplasmata archaeon]|nr:hypothetical protein [Thermoplasmata archaeon]